MYSVYIIINISNKKPYVGWSGDFDKRISQHYQDSYNSNQPAYNTIFHRAIRKYGWHNFNSNIIYQSYFIDHIKEAEEHFIREYNSHYRYGFGYNMTYGGEGTKGVYRSPEVRTNMSNAQKGKKKSQQTKEKLFNSMLKFGDKIAKTWEIITPQGNTIIIKNLRRFCIDNGLDQGNMMKVVNGFNTHCKGYKCSRI